MDLGTFRLPVPLITLLPLFILYLSNLKMFTLFITIKTQNKALMYLLLIWTGIFAHTF